MPILIAKLGAHRNDDAIMRLAHYMSSKENCCFPVARGVITHSIESIIESFEFIKKMYEKNEVAKKHISHFIIGTKKSEGISICHLYEISLVVADYFYARGFQCYSIIHNGSANDPEYVHLHIAVNTVNFRDGTRLYETYSNTSDLCRHLSGYFPYCKWFSANDTSDSYD